MDSRLLKFTGAEASRYAINRPWHDTGWDYATDGYVCVRVPAIPSKETEVGDCEFQKAVSLFTQASASAKWVPWPDFPADHPREPCPSCGEVYFYSRGKKHVKCIICDGDGTYQCCHCGSIVDCETCDGTGRIATKETCDVCGGNETVPGPVVIAGRKIKGIYADRIILLGGAEYLEDGGSCASPLVFRASGGLEGRVMPLEKEWRLR